MAWIESHQALGHHPKTIALAAALHCNLPCAVGYLHYLWWWALDYAPDGIVRMRAQSVVARACEWRGRPERFWDALIDTGFVEPLELDDLCRIHDWMDYAGRLVQQRAANAERMRNARAAHVRRTSGTRAGATHDARAALPDRTGPDQPEVNPSSLPLHARPPARGANDPTLVAEHLARIDQERQQRQRHDVHTSENGELLC